MKTYKITIEQLDETIQDPYNNFKDIFTQVINLDKDEDLRKVIRFLNGDDKLLNN